MMKSGERGKIVMVRRRPSDVKMWRIALCLVFGLFGAHNFFTGRKIRGCISLVSMFIFIVSGLVIYQIDALEEYWVQLVSLISTPALVIWVMDAFGIVFGWYKYPVRLGDAKKDA